MSSLHTEGLEALFAGKTSIIARDLKLNLNRLLTDGALTPEEALLTLLATASSVEALQWVEYARIQLSHYEVSQEQIEEAVESAALMGMLNTYYRFKHMMNSPDYTSAGLRMTALARPALGKVRFEMLAFAVSVLNGCEMCIQSHEKALRDAGVSLDKIHDLARLAAVVKGLKPLY